MNSLKKQSLCFSWMLLILVVAVVFQAAAQSGSGAGVTAPCTTFPTVSTSGTTVCGDTDAKSAPRADDSSATPAPPESPAQVMLDHTPVTQTLDGEPVFEPRPFHLQFLYGGRLIGGFESSAIGPNSSLKDTGLASYDGYLGLALQTRKSYFVLQQDSYGNRYTASDLPGRYLFQTSVLAAGEWTPAASWYLEGHSTEGYGALLFLSALPSTPVGQTVGTLPSAADLGLDNSFAIYPDASGGIRLKLTPESTLNLYAKDSYREVFDNNTHDNVAIFRPSYMVALSSKTEIGVYGLGTRETGEIDCRTNGGGLEFSTHFLKTGYVDAWGGPQIGSKGCIRQQLFQAHVEVSMQTGRTTDLFLLANRENGNTLVAGSAWEQNVAVGIQKRFTRSVVLRVDGGYVDGTHFGNAALYQGWFGSVELRRRISSNLLLSAAYRRFDNNETTPTLHRNVALFSIIFSPARRVRSEARNSPGEIHE